MDTIHIIRYIVEGLSVLTGLIAGHNKEGEVRISAVTLIIGGLIIILM
jgi:hypothetical protein